MWSWFAVIGALSAVAAWFLFIGKQLENADDLADALDNQRAMNTAHKEIDSETERLINEGGGAHPDSIARQLPAFDKLRRAESKGRLQDT